MDRIFHGLCACGKQESCGRTRLVGSAETVTCECVDAENGQGSKLVPTSLQY